MSKFKTAALIAIVFGLLTIFSGGSTLFAGLDMGTVVPFVLWFNFLAGFAYVTAGLGLWGEKPWAARLSMLITTATLLVAFAFAIHVLRGLPYEPRTLGALVFRCGVWLWIAWVARSLTRPALL
ncbi:hypothetical protein SAMN05444000_1446 [Shimia gijangensis]|uniref:Uncharacterized protein n=1 Tax=Shimia gijangensis TaxID=1470563 RepID=A0A1M6TRM3_9RHOB|nr:hypothetical protein [Shimia gijangensis]SHK59587.1 hypothetical protein SAMN05444000_1446 [Shimia gijangensis]